MAKNESEKKKKTQIEEKTNKNAYLFLFMYFIPIFFLIGFGYTLYVNEKVDVSENIIDKTVEFNLSLESYKKNKLKTLNTAAAPAEEKQDDTLFVEMDPITVNLRRGNARQQRYLKLKVRFEVQEFDHKDIISKIMPRIRDQFQVFLRELRVEDLEGSTGAYRIREELLHRINIVARPAVVTDILFDELLVQ